MQNRGIIALIALFCALVAPAWASESGCSDITPLNGKASVEGLKVYVDPETGQLLSEPPLGEPLDLSAQISPVPGTVEIHQEVQPDGSVVADIGDRFITELRVEIVDGKAVTCHRSAAKTQLPDAEADSRVEKTLDDGR